MSTFCKGILKSGEILLNRYICPSVPNNQVRSLQLWADWRMKKDVRKRQALEDHFELKLRLNAMRKNKILPPEIKELATEDLLQKLPNDVKGLKIRGRCVLTSRPRGNVLRWRLSRIMFRHIADYNKMAGIQRAMWGY